MDWSPTLTPHGVTIGKDEFFSENLDIACNSQPKCFSELVPPYVSTCGDRGLGKDDFQYISGHFMHFPYNKISKFVMPPPPT